MSEFITIKEASKRHGVSVRTIRRRIKEHALRTEGTVEARTLKVDSEELSKILTAEGHAPQEAEGGAEKTQQEAEPQAQEALASTIEVLREQLISKDKAYEAILASKDKAYEALNDRLRESNNLLAREQEQVRLLSAPQQASTGTSIGVWIAVLIGIVVVGGVVGMLIYIQ